MVKFEDWVNTYNPDLQRIFLGILNILKKKNLLNKTINYTDFCKFIYSVTSEDGRRY
jgi:hypothetical protein